MWTGSDLKPQPGIRLGTFVLKHVLEAAIKAKHALCTRTHGKHTDYVHTQLMQVCITHTLHLHTPLKDRWHPHALSTLTVHTTISYTNYYTYLHYPSMHSSMYTLYVYFTHTAHPLLHVLTH